MGLLTSWLASVWLVSVPPVVLALVPLDAPGASPGPMVYPTQGNGFADYIVGGFLGLGILVLFMVWTSRRPKRPS